MDKLIPDIESMLPHRKPMLMISKLLDYDDQKLSAQAVIHEDNPLLESGMLPGHAALELVAQASGLFLGLNLSGEAKPGAIVSVRDMQVHTPWIACGESLMIETQFLGGSESAAMFQGRVMHDQTLVLETTLTVSSFSEGAES